MDDFLRSNLRSSARKTGVWASVLVFRMEDIVYSHPELAPEREDSEQSDRLWKRRAESFAKAVIAHCINHSGKQLILYQFPSSPGKVERSKQATTTVLGEFAKATGLSNLHLAPSTPSFFELYPAFASKDCTGTIPSSAPAAWYDKAADKAAHAPLTSIAVTALGQLISRQTFRCLPNLKPRKVIVLDCDNTLWRSAVGEVGPMGVQISGQHRFLQQYFARLHDQGMLLCLCSKNNESDVIEVFRQRKNDMVLDIDKHIVAHRINWKEKVDNLQCLAKHLNLALNSFVFVDDNPGECALVRSRLPEVSVVQIPYREEQIASYLRHSWVFDRPVTLGSILTEEDGKRTEMYRAATEREKEFNGLVENENGNDGAERTGWRDFIGSLAVKANFQNTSTTKNMNTKIPRIIQLMERTNQFNASALKKSRSDIVKLVGGEAGPDCFALVSVTDRFGHYGDVGLLVWQPSLGTPDCSSPMFWVQIFLLSCRALQRGVEHLMLRHVGNVAKHLGYDDINVQWKTTDRNSPAKLFLQSIPHSVYCEKLEAFVISAKEACRCEPGHAPKLPSQRAAGEATATTDERAKSTAQSARTGALVPNNADCATSATLEGLRKVVCQLSAGDTATLGANSRTDYNGLFKSLKRSGSDPRARGVIRDEIKVMLGETPFDSKKHARLKEDEESRKKRRKQEKIERGRLWRLKNGLHKKK
eukprot:g2133.t1